jgi:D-aminoacyl-tRNA deacylase
MRAVVQRVSKASVAVDTKICGEIGAGLLVLLGIHRDDGENEVNWLVDKIIHLRIFSDDAGKMNRSLLDTGGAMLIVSQFTLYGDCRKGRRPGYSTAASPDKADFLYQRFVNEVKQRNITAACGQFQTHMVVDLTNDGPVTLLLDSSKLF